VHGWSSLEDADALLDTPARHHGQVTAAPEFSDDARQQGGNRDSQARVSIECSAAIFMRERHNRNYPVLENMWLQNAFRASERATWIVLAVILLVALSGLLAHGPLSKSTVTDGGLSLTYERFQRVTALARFNARILVSYGDEASLRRARISEEDGLERMDEIKFAIFEASGRISIIPKRNIVTSEDGSAPGGD